MEWENRSEEPSGPPVSCQPMSAYLESGQPELPEPDTESGTAVAAHWYCTDCERTTQLDGSIMKRCTCGRYMSVRDDGDE